ncbi:MAG: hypothetical protein HFF79_07370 [Oscillospiraceae bacterium]|nr:hypothetical protein [Oscillospiraceae bacterium]
MEAAISKKQAEQSYQLLLRCGAQRAPSDFCSQLVKELANLLAYGQGAVSGQVRKDLRLQAFGRQ